MDSSLVEVPDVIFYTSKEAIVNLWVHVAEVVLVVI